MPDRLQSDGDAGKFIRESSSSSTRFPPIRIGSDGKWYLGDSAFNKPAMVKLLVSRLRRQGNKYYLQEDRWRLPIVVDDLPLQIVALARQPDNSVQLHTSEGECLTLGAAHRLALSRLATTAHVLPMVFVRDGLWARFARSTYYQLIDEAFEGQLKPSTFEGSSSNTIFKEQLSLLDLSALDSALPPLLSTSIADCLVQEEEGLWLRSDDYLVDLMPLAVADSSVDA